jgi:hypothetical protein
MPTYEIIRSFGPGHPDRPNESEVIETGLTLDQAQEHCESEDTHGPQWFDGYREE